MATASAATPRPVPEVGQLVRVRDRHWVVAELTASILPHDVIAGDQPAGRLVALCSVPRLIVSIDWLKRPRAHAVSPEARQELLDRLLELNHQRQAEEVAAGLHEKRPGTKKSKARASLF